MTKEDRFMNYADLTPEGKFANPIEFKTFKGEEIPSSVVIYQPFLNGKEPEVGDLIGFTTNWPQAGVYWDGNGILITNKKRRDHES